MAALIVLAVYWARPILMVLGFIYLLQLTGLTHVACEGMRLGLRAGFEIAHSFAYEKPAEIANRYYNSASTGCLPAAKRQVKSDRVVVVAIGDDIAGKNDSNVQKINW